MQLFKMNVCSLCGVTENLHGVFDHIDQCNDLLSLSFITMI